MSEITVTVNGQSGPNVTATTGDTVGVSVNATTAAYTVNVTQAGTPGGIGPTGPQGPAYTTVAVGNTTTLSSGSNATVTATSSNNGANLTLNFGIPAGAQGAAGPTPSFSIGNVSTVAAGGSAAVTAATTNNGANVTLNFAIPRGADGAAGSSGSNVTLSDATPSNLGTASAGTSTVASRSDHVHALPTIAYSNLSGVPTNFPTNTTLVSGLSAGYSAANHGHNYVTALNNLTGALSLVAGNNVSISSANSTLTISASGGGGGLDENGTVDGGSYVGEILGGITFTTQPQSVTATVGGYSEANISMPTGTGYAVSYANGTWFATPNDVSGGDYIAKSTDGVNWTRTLAALPYAGAWSPVVYGNGVYVTVNNDSTASRRCATSTDGVTWTARTIPNSNAGGWPGDVVFAGGSFVATTNGVNDPSVWVSPDGVTWAAVTPGNAIKWYRPVSVDGNLLMAGWRNVDTSYFVSIALSTNGGTTWYVANTNIQGDGQTAISGIVSDGTTISVFVGSYYVTSTDGGSSFSSGSYVYGGGNVLGTTNVVRVGSRYVATVFSGSNLSAWSSNDGVNWTLRQASLGGTSASLVNTASGVFALVLDTSRNPLVVRAWYSQDGLSWTQQSARNNALSTTLALNSDATKAVSYYGARNFQRDFVCYTFSGSGASATFTAIASASGGQSVSYQWQSSTDAGTTWANVANATTTSLGLTGLTTANSGTRYRSVASATGAASVNSQSATLTVNG